MTASLPPMHRDTHDPELLNMTVPLPPPDGFDPKSGEYLFKASTLKLAVREALERAITAVKNRAIGLPSYVDAKEAEEAIRTMIEDYK